MPNDDQLSGEDLTALMKVRASLDSSDPRGPKIDAFIKSQLANYVPDATAQSRAQLSSKVQTVWSPQAGLKSLNTPLPRPPGGGEEATLAAGAGPALTGLLAIGAPGATAGGLVGGYAGKKLAEGANLGPTGQTIAEIGGGLAGGLAGGGGQQLLQKALPGALRSSAGSTLNTLRQTAGKIPVDTGQFGDQALALFTQDARGASLPTPVRKLINRLTAPGKPPLTYEEAKDFQSNISNLLANPVGEEGARLKNANTYRLVTQLNEGLKNSLESASQVAGADPGTFSGAMRGYAEASSRQDMMDRIHDLATKGVKIGAGGVVGGAAAGLGYDIFKIIKESVAGKP